MKTNLITGLGLFFLLLLAGCDDGDEYVPDIKSQQPSENVSSELPDGYFEVTFSPGYGDANTRTPVTTVDGRVRHLRYIIYKSTGEFVKEKIILKATDAAPKWPLDAVKDTLPQGQYKAVFLANVQKDLFPIPVQGGGTTTAEVLTNYTTTYANARIVLPNAPFTDTSEYYWANVDFSNTNAHPYILLQRIIGMLNLHRNFVDAQTALNQLTNNVVTQINQGNYLENTVRGLLLTSIKQKLDKGVLGNVIYDVLGGLDKTVNLVAGALLTPVVNLLYQQLLQGVVDQIGMALTGNTDQAGTLATLGVLLNPWAQNEANTPIVTIRNFPKTMDFDLNVIDKFAGDQRFRCAFSSGTVYDEKDVLIKGFNGTFDVRKINVIKQGLVSGLLIDQTIDSSLLLNGAFVDITDPIQAPVGSNYRYKANYSFVDLGLVSYNQQTDGNHSLTLSVQLGKIANLDNILGGIPLLGDVLNATIRGLIGDIVISVPINLPLLGVSNLSLSGSWSPVKTY